MVARVAEDAGVRALAIKGPIMGLHGLRGRDHLSADVDVLVESHRLPDLHPRLLDLGWVAQKPQRAPRLTARHSFEYWHDAWPCSLDLHIRYPGIFLEATEVFELMWQERSFFHVGGRDIAATSKIDTAIIALCHQLRNGSSRTATSMKIDPLTDAKLHSSSDGISQSEFAARVRALEAGYALRPALVEFSIPVPQSPGRECEEHEWNLYGEKALPGLAAFESLRKARLNHIPGLVLGAMWPSREELLIRNPAAAGNRWSLCRLRWTRLLGAVRSAPRLILRSRQTRVGVQDE